MQRAKIQAASKMSALGEMAGGIAHEINNPLTIILTLSLQLEEWTESGEQIDPEYLKLALKNIASTSQRIAKIVEGLRFFSRDGTHDPFQAASIKSIIQDTLSLCHERFRGRSISLTFNEVADELSIECKATQISQVLLNLLNNAFDAVNTLPEKWVKVEIIDHTDHVDILLTDSGSGISEEVKTKMFQPFFTTKEIGKGTGLGLSISKGIIETHQGSLTLEEQSKNTCFRITLPKKNLPGVVQKLQ